MKKNFTLFVCALMSVAMWASSAADLKPINRNWSFIADNITNSGTTQPTAETLYEGDFIFIPTANSVSASKGQNTINGNKCYNSLRIKLAQDRLAFAVYDACTITFYTENHKERGLLVSTVDNNTDTTKALAKQPVSTPVWKTTLPAAGTYYLTSYGKDFFLGGFTVEFEGGGEAVTEYTVSYVNTTGEVLGTETVAVGGTLDAFKYGEADVTVPEGKAFRGWFTSAAVGATKFELGSKVENDLRIYAQATDIEVAETGKFYIYDLTKPFYQEDHECVSITGAAYNEASKGWLCEANAIVNIPLGSNIAYVSFNDAEAEPYSDNNTLTFSFSEGAVLKTIRVYYVSDEVKKDEKTGYYIPAANDGAALIYLMSALNEGDKIFLPNGIYDLGETCLTTINKNNVSIIGQSMEGTIIKNAPDASLESIDKTATIKINKNVSGTYLQDLTIQNALDYYKFDNGRAVCLWDQGTKTVCKNVRLLSYQDTYYSNLSGAVKYLEDCEIHGTVDFICGDGSVYFKNNLLYAEKRKKNGGGNDALTANNGPATDKGYVFEGCTVKSECPVVSFGRAWNNTPQCTFLNTKIDYSAGSFVFQNDEIQRWTKELMSKETGWPIFGEYNTRTTEGELLTPESNIVTFRQKAPLTGTQDIQTVLTEEEAAKFTIEYTLGGWAATAKAEATQAEAETEASQLDPDGIYLIESEGEFQAIIKGSEFMDKFALYDGKVYTIRKANARGGFGPKAGEAPQGIEETVSHEMPKVMKIFRDGQVYIVRDGKSFNVMGAEIK